MDRDVFTSVHVRKWEGLFQRSPKIVDFFLSIYMYCMYTCFAHSTRVHTHTTDLDTHIPVYIISWMMHCIVFNIDYHKSPFFLHYRIFIVKQGNENFLSMFFHGKIATMNIWCDHPSRYPQSNKNSKLKRKITDILTTML